jgi:small subunit ribosomal protein S9
LDEKVAIGRRKTAVASVRLRPGSGLIDINGKKVGEYFPSDIQKNAILSPFEKIGGNTRHDMIVRVKGGGIEGQVDAIRLGVSRALVMEDDKLREDLKAKGFLTRDPRKRERKKYGQPGARKRFQFSKR